MTLRDPAWRSRARPLLGTLVEVSLRGADDADFVRISNRMFERIAHFQRTMSFHERGSDLRAIARAVPGGRVLVAPETWSVLAAALALEAESAGAFNCGIGHALVAAGARPMPDAAGTAPPARRAAVSARASIRLDAGDIVTVLRPIWIDLGGIAKGAAVDAALAIALQEGVEAALVDAGGDLRTFGAPGREIDVRGPDGVRRHAGHVLDAAVATSGPFIGAGPSADRPDYVPTRGSIPCWADRSVTVIAPDCQTADGLTKVVIAIGAEAAPLLARHGAQAFAIDGHGRLERMAA